LNDTVDAVTLEQMAAYYRDRAPEYDEWWLRRGRYDRGPELNGRWFAEAEQVYAALDDIRMGGDVLELAPGSGTWTERLLRTASSVTAVDASPEMLALNRARLRDDRVSYVLADLFEWRPPRWYDGALFGFWLSHVPLERLPGFLATVAAALKPDGKLFFVDSRREDTGTAADHTLPEQGSQTMVRRLNDGREYSIVKNFHNPEELAARLARAGLDVRVRETPTYFLYGAGARGGGSEA
jgi:demethylmenaquinone methyltransferase/2-methoxy-6-polyprenyl-1,4-benzoquinol methylase